MYEQVLVLAVKASTYELFVLLIFYIAAILFFGFFIYYAETFIQPDRLDSGPLITNIPLGLWYSLETVTTVGYGDMYPVTWAGYLIGAMCQLMGVILLALTIPVVSSNFTMFYTYVRSRDPRKYHRRMERNRRKQNEVLQKTINIDEQHTNK